MAPISVLLGNFGICTRDPGCSLTITSSISLTLPDNWETNVSAADLFKEVEKGNLWIARAGTCSLDIIHDSNHEDSPALLQGVLRNIPRHLAIAVEQCPIWCELGLKLERRGNHLSRGASHQEQITFSIQHPDLNSELLAPEGIPCASFLALSCLLSIQTKPPDDRKRKRSANKSKQEIGSRQAKRSRSERDQLHLSRNSQRCIDGSEIFSQEVTSQASEARSNVSGQPATGHNVDGEVISKLVSSALYALMGVKKQMVGLKLIGDAPSPSLIEIAPAVWSIPYLKARALRSSFLPTITSVLGGLVHAESPRLRHKVATLLDSHSSQSSTDMDDISREIRRRLEVHLQGSFSFNPVSRVRDTRSRTRLGDAKRTNQTDNHHSGDECIEMRSAVDLSSDIRLMDYEEGDDALPDQQQMTQRSLQDVADEINALQAEMAAMLGYHLEEFSPYDNLSVSQNSYGDYQDDLNGDDSQFPNDPRTGLSGAPLMSHLQGPWDQDVFQNEGYESSMLPEMQNVECIEPQNWDVGQFYGPQGCTDGVRGANTPNNGPEQSGSNELLYTWNQVRDLSFTEDLDMSQPRDFGELNTTEELGQLNDGIYSDNLSPNAGGSFTRYGIPDTLA